jgi:type III secretion protein C
MPPKSEKEEPARSSYESLTEERGSFKLIKDQKEQAEKEKLAAEKAAAKKAEPTPPPEEPLQEPKTAEGPLINFNNVSITEVLKYASRLTGKNFLYDPQELQFSITMISDSPTSVEEVMAMLIQSLRVHGLSLIEEGDAFVIHTNPSVRAVGALDDHKGIEGPQIATQVFVLQNNDAERCAAVVKTMVSEGSIVEAVGDSKLIVSDVTENLRRIADVIKQLEAQSGSLEIGQYVAVNLAPSDLINICQRILEPLTATKPLVLVPHSASNSVFIVSTPFLIEKALSVMQTIDLNQAHSGLLSSDQLKFDPAALEKARKLRASGAAGGVRGEAEASVDLLSPEELRKLLLEQGFQKEQIDAFTLDAARDALKRSRKLYSENELPIGTLEGTQFHIYQLQYRKSSDIATALRAISSSLVAAPGAGADQKSLELTQTDLVVTLNSVQAVDDNNTVVFTGTRSSIERVKELIAQIDRPARQVFIEALILDTTLTNSLQFGVEWGGKLQRTNYAAQTGFFSPDSATFSSQFNSVSFDALGQPVPVKLSPVPPPGGFSVNSIGRKIKFLGKGFRSTGALIQALHVDNEAHVIMNPKIVTEHNIAAEVFVGANVPIKGQSIANANIGGTSSIVSTNYETQQTGVLLKVTPLISSQQTVTLIIEQRISAADATQVAAQGGQTAPPATVKEIRTITRVHLPSDHFLVMSGLIMDDTLLKANKIPCLGGLPLIGNLFGNFQKTYDKRNLMLFIRPIIIDTELEMDSITKRQEEILKQKSQVQQGWNKEVDDAKTMLNLQP